MKDLEQELLTGKRLMYYLLTVETTLLLTIGAWFTTAYPNLVTKDELQQLAPYVADRDMINHKLVRHDKSLDKTIQMIEKLDRKFSMEIKALEVSLARIEGKNVKW